MEDLKSAICKRKYLNPEELLVISGGKECQDSDEISPDCFVLVRNGADRIVEVNIKVAGDKTKAVMSMSLPINTSINKLKENLLKEKFTKWSITGQRLIASSRVMKDHHILGDYMIHQTQPNKKTAVQPALTIYLSQTIDSRAEIEFLVTLCNKQELKFYFEYGIPLYYAKDILYKQFSIPKDVEYLFEVESGVTLYDMNKSLLDYGIFPSEGKKMCVSLVMLSPRVNSPKIAFMPHARADSVDTLKKNIQNLSVPVTSTFNILASGENISRPCSHISTTNLKKIPESKRKSPTCGMFGGMKKGLISSSLINRKKK